MDGSLFISYSHVDSVWMRAFRKHLNGILLHDCAVWTDEDIAAGTTWEERLLGNLRQAAAGLVLVSPDYLVSPWCRRELKTLADAYKSKRLAAVFWVLLKPCGWKWTELSGLQAAHEPGDEGLLSVSEDPARDVKLLRCCETIANQLLPMLRGGDKSLAVVRGILARNERGARFTPVKTLSEGDFSIVVSGVDGVDVSGKHVVIQVFTNTPLRRMRELLSLVGMASGQIDVPSAIRTLDVFTDGEGYEQRVVIVSELARGKLLSDVMAADSRRADPSERDLTPNRIGHLLRGLAEAIKALHLIDSLEWEGEPNKRYRHLMGPMPPTRIYYDCENRRAQISLVSVTSLLWRFFEPGTFRNIVGSTGGVYLLPEKLDGKPVDERADQYFLGLLALELMEARQLFQPAGNERPADPADILEKARWVKRHEQFGEIVRRLLKKDPGERFTDMDGVIAELDCLEDSSRALAKYSFRTYVAPSSEQEPAGTKFSRAFYAKFFRETKGAEAVFLREHDKRVAGTVSAGLTLAMPEEAQHRKLMDGLKAVLNFRPGGNPSAIDSVAIRHADMEINLGQLESFERCFLSTLGDFVSDQGDIADMAEICKAWSGLFKPVISMMYRTVPARLALSASV